MKKRMSFLLLAIVLIVTMLPLSASADSSKLSANDIDYLKTHVKLTQEEVDSLPKQVLKELILNEAVKVGSKKQAFSEGQTRVGVSPRLGSSDMDLSLSAYTVKSDRVGYKKVYLYGEFTWKNNPTSVFTDVMTIGIPESKGFFLPVNNSTNTVQQHSSAYNWFQKTDGWKTESSTTPTKFYANSGVSNEYDLRAGSNMIHKGYISQYMYVKNTESGTTNVTLQYGHSKLSITPSVSIWPAGIGIQPGISIEVYPIIFELTY